MVSSAPPSANSRSGYESLFRHAFTTNRYIQFTPTNPPTSMPNEACGDAMQPDFEGLYVWSNNVNTLSLTHDLTDLHELCRQFKHYDIGIAALQELNIDMTQTAIPAQSLVSSYTRGSTHLDYILVTPDLLSYVDTAGLNHYHEFYPSDHRPLFVGLDASLFGPFPSMTHHKSRYVHSNSKTVGPFIEAAYKHLVDTGTFPRLNSFLANIATLSDQEISQKANSIDDQMTKALLSAERKCNPT
jgi:hypothetical protein